MTEDELLALGEEGFIAGPGESAEELQRRAAFCKNLKETFQLYPLEEAAAIVSGALPLTEKLYGIAPSWILCFFSNHELKPWHGGCAWIFKENDKSPTAAFLQLRKGWRGKDQMLGLYKRDELIAHELSHVGRMMFEEPIYEEFFAYLTSSSPFQRFFGPLIRSSYESMAFVVTLFTLVLLDAISLFSGYLDVYEKLQWLKFLPIGMVLYAAGRLFFRQGRFRKARGKFGRGLYLLTDAEIDEVYALSPQEVEEWVENHKDKELRLTQLFLWMRR
ncbi:MAG: hypothetical protein KDK48_05805 [Chlamydiia bacterium]|nr:hypothetical protein [Chlamydiia bacterium]